MSDVSTAANADRTSRRGRLVAVWRGSVPPRAIMPAPRAIGPLLAVLVCALYALTYSAKLTSRDGGVMFDTTMAVVDRHTLSLPPHHHGLPGVGHGYYSKYGFAQSVAEIPLYLLGDIIAARTPGPLGHVVALAIAMLTNPLITALAVWLFFLLAYELSGSVRGSALAALLIGLASPYWPYAKTDFSEPLSALALTGAVLFLVRARARPSLAHFLVSGLFMALAFLTKLTALVMLPAMGLYALYVAATASPTAPIVWRRLAVWSLPLLCGAAVQGWYNLARFGSLTESGYHGDDVPFHAPLLTGLDGLLLSTGKGLLWYCPVLLLALALWPRLVRRRRAEGLLALGLILPTLIVFATYPVWWGGFCWGPRYLVPILPMLLLPLALLLPGVGASTWRRNAAIAVVALSVVVQSLGVAIHPSRYILAGPGDQSLLWDPGRSPLLGHAWLMAYDVAIVVNRADAAAMLEEYPWPSGRTVSLDQKIVIQAWPFWWWAVLGSHGLGRLAQVTILLLLLLVIVATLWRLRDLRRPDPASPFDHWHMAVHL